ncbi:MAG: chloride channel protein [Lachnospiraceae bacterium]|nr:chloride channel protein [Lachnospiraceae bacterium]
MQKDCFRNGFYSVKILLKWLVIGIIVGLIVGTVSSLFGHALVFVNGFRNRNPLIVLGLPVAGLIIVFLYRFFKDTDDKGTNMVITSIQSSTDIPFRMMPLIFVSTVLTHLCGGSAGREGAALQIGGSIANRLGKVFQLNEDDRHVIIMCGMSAGFSALFGTPMAAAVFSMEVVSVGVMHYAALVPCVTGALIGHFVAQFFKVPPEVFPVMGVQAMDIWGFLKITAFAALVAGVSIVFCVTLHTAEHLYEKYFRNPYLRIAVAGCVVVLLSMALRTDFYLGSGMGIIKHIFHEGHTEWYTFLLKMIFTALTLGAGFKGGEIVPSFCIGVAFGCAVAPLFGLPVGLVAACGMVGLFCGVTNSPLTSLLIAFELFGFEGMPYFLITVAVSYMLSGYFGLYRAQRIMYSKTEDHVVDTCAH